MSKEQYIREIIKHELTQLTDEELQKVVAFIRAENEENEHSPKASAVPQLTPDPYTA